MEGLPEAATGSLLYKKLLLKILQYPHETPVSESFLKTVAGLKAPTQVLSCKYCKIFKTTYFEKHMRTATF